MKSLKGKILIADPGLRDQNFVASVVLICEHNLEGAFGLIINRKSTAKCETVLEVTGPETQENQVELFIGGPVQTNQVLILYRSKSIPVSNKIIFEDLALATQISDLSTFDSIDEFKSNTRFYMGCAGWSKNQLEGEISEGAWKILNANMDHVFSSQPDKLWSDCLGQLGGRYSILAKLPDMEDLLNN